MSNLVYLQYMSAIIKYFVANILLSTNLIDNVFLCRFRFWQWGRWVEIRVDDRLPTRGDRPAYMHCAQPDVFWAALLEKAYAKLYGGYAFLKYGTVGRALQDLTGAVVQSVPPSGPLLGGAVPRSTLLLAISGSVSLNYETLNMRLVLNKI